MLSFRLQTASDAPLSMLAIGAHPDDIEIGAGGLLLSIAEQQPQVRYVLITGTAERHQEARHAASSFLPGADIIFDLFDLPEGRLPAAWGTVKEILEEVARSCAPDLIIAPSASDAHQDHRTIGELVTTVFRDQLYLAYEIPKWDGDMGRPVMYQCGTEVASLIQAKVESGDLVSGLVQGRHEDSPDISAIAGHEDPHRYPQFGD
jgi:LmbE family N-acetylglucosaminyl deacetylase